MRFDSFHLNGIPLKQLKATIGVTKSHTKIIILILINLRMQELSDKHIKENKSSQGGEAGNTR